MSCRDSNPEKATTLPLSQISGHLDVVRVENKQKGEAEVRTTCDTKMNVMKIKRKKSKTSFWSIKIATEAQKTQNKIATPLETQSILIRPKFVKPMKKTKKKVKFELVKLQPMWYNNQ